MATFPEPLLLLAGDLRVCMANRSFYDTFRVTPAETENHFFFHLGNGQWARPILRQLLEDILPHGGQFDHFEVEHTFEHIGTRTMLLNAQQLKIADGKPDRILLVIADVTAPKQARQALFAELEQHVQERTAALQAANRQLEVSREELRSLSAALEAAREEERTHMAREVHDVLGQQLSALKMDVSAIRMAVSADAVSIHARLQGVSALLDESIQTVRRIASELRPPLLDEFGLEAAMQWHLDDFCRRSNLIYKLHAPEHGIQLPPDRSLAIFRIFQEALTNVARHSAATALEVTLEAGAEDLVLYVRDNGRGISTTNLDRVKTLGLMGMRERVRLLSGKIHITGVRGNGTTVAVRIPIVAPLANAPDIRTVSDYITTE